MGAGGFHVRVRDGIGCRLPAIATRSSNAPCGFVAHEGVQVLVFFAARGARRVMCVQACCSGCVSSGVWMIAAHDGKSFPCGGSDRLVGLCGIEPIGRLGPVS